MSPWQKWCGIALAGSLGAITRYALTACIQRWGGPDFPWGTWAVNMVGCFLFGLVMGSSATWLTPERKVIVLTGFMGALTTFSTFGFETANLLQRQHMGLAGANVLGQVCLGVVLVAVGEFLGKFF